MEETSPVRSVPIHWPMPLLRDCEIFCHLSSHPCTLDRLKDKTCNYPVRWSPFMCPSNHLTIQEDLKTYSVLSSIQIKCQTEGFFFSPIQLCNYSERWQNLLSFILIVHPCYKPETTHRCLVIIFFIDLFLLTWDIIAALLAIIPSSCCLRKSLCIQQRTSWWVCPLSMTSWMNNSTTTRSSYSSRRGTTEPSYRCLWTHRPAAWTAWSGRCRIWGTVCKEPRLSWLRLKNRASRTTSGPNAWLKAWWWCGGRWMASASNQEHLGEVQEEKAWTWSSAEEVVG